ncbi:D-alanine-D-alanine ligase [Dethiosulfatibacter aminovorans DSM 17477]|uniref:D-alanine-D-alanine ligase n=1 Tax=Dethiosulfatibacter aminovorans DSM 17477 TaxID=1121476 RepID=A0A1M6JVS9_9FIRM|nr:ATP-grasp domain-containing protein [Dethiosulfatibacter aminovorans]SHJ50786.1 D-alanine-D-alanine ligase [Dethiosulfatibacter aminovorans DSM 17477]
MRVAIIYNEDRSGVINTFGMQNKETYSSKIVKKVASSLEKGGHNVEIIDGNMNVIDNIRNFLPRVKEGEKFGLVFNMAYGIQGESRYTHIPAMLEMLGIPYVGSSPSGHAIALDKVITKIILQKNNIPTPDFWTFSSSDEDMENIDFPVIVKPKMESVSFGLRVVDNVEDLRDAVDFIVSEFKQQALVEKFIRGREFAVGLLGNDPVEIFPVLEIDLEGDPDAIQTVEDKLKKPKAKICPADIPEELSRVMKDISLKVFKVLGLRDFARVDIRLDEEGNAYVLEVNSMASLGANGSYVNAADKCGYTFTSLVNRILDVAANRYFAEEFSSSSLYEKTTKVDLPARLRGYFRNNNQNTQRLLEELVNINSHVKNINGINRVGNIMKSKLSDLGFSQEIFSQSEVGNIMFFTNTQSETYDCLIIGNLDNIKGLGEHDYFSSSDHKYFGSGVWENKGGLSVMLLALKGLKYSRLLGKVKIGILLTTDDTMKGSYSRRIIKDKSSVSKAVLGLHGAYKDGGMVTTRSGSALYHLEMTLKSFTDNSDVAMASAQFAKIIGDLSKMTDSEKGIIIAPKKASMDTNISEPFVRCEAQISVKYRNSDTFENIDARIRKAASALKSKKMLEFQIEGGRKRSPMEYSEASQSLMENIIELGEKLDIKVSGEHRWSSANIALSDSTKPMIDGFGPNGFKDRKGNEYILSHTISEKALLLAMTLKELTNL